MIAEERPSDEHGDVGVGDAQTSYLLRREAIRRTSVSAVSPPAVEATLASISAEVMEEAIARRRRPVVPRVAESTVGTTIGAATQTNQQ